ncbi:MAG: HEPN domain-containing protein [Planctomycetes bacterium]|nr:HEPN domain-containing protein [Planctomycetota bacterium]
MKSPSDLVKGWIAKAESDLVSARTLLAGPGPYDGACFHCQQAAEKLMKGFLASREQAFPFTHNLDELARLCDDLEPSLNLSRADIIGLTDFAVRLRYDNDFWPTHEDATAAMRLAEEVYRIVLNVMGQ